MKSDEVKKSAKGLARRIVLGVAIIVLFASAAFLINHYIIEPYKYICNNRETSVTNESDTQTTVIGSEGDTTVNIQAKYSALLRQNPEFVGKLYISAIDDAGFNVVQADDNSKYLTTGFKGETTRYGTLFVDYRNNIEKLDTNTIIYGHNMRDGSQLGSLSLYNNIDNYKSFPVIEFNTIYGNCKWKVFAAFITNSEKKEDNGYVFPYLTTEFKSDEVFMRFIDAVKERSYYTNDAVDIIAGDKILTLSTCDTVFHEARCVVMARLVRDGESAEVDVSRAVKNENQRFPQAWYDKKGKSNPFKNTADFTLD